MSGRAITIISSGIFIKTNNDCAAKHCKFSADEILITYPAHPTSLLASLQSLVHFVVVT